MDWNRRAVNSGRNNFRFLNWLHNRIDETLLMKYVVARHRYSDVFRRGTPGHSVRCLPPFWWRQSGFFLQKWRSQGFSVGHGTGLTRLMAISSWNIVQTVQPSPTVPSPTRGRVSWCADGSLLARSVPSRNVSMEFSNISIFCTISSVFKSWINSN